MRDFPAILMLAWVGWLAIPWPTGGLAHASAPSHSAYSAPRVRPEPQSTLAGSDGTGPLRAAATAQAPTSVSELMASERARIAGEVHDAAGHGLAAIAMQAKIALLLLDDQPDHPGRSGKPDQIRESLEAIRSTSVRALSQLRSALDLIEPEHADHDLSQLIDGVRAAGLPVEVEPAEPGVPAHLESTVYRVVRESLTNVLRHAGPTKAVVRLADNRGEFVLEVIDKGRGSSGTVEGRGLAGMRAGVLAAGGTFSAGPREGGGFHILAGFPSAPHHSGMSSP